MFKSRLFIIIALMLIGLEMIPGIWIVSQIYPPRREVDRQEGLTPALYALGALLAMAVLLFIAHRAPADTPFLGESRRTWLGILYITLIVGLGAGIAFGIYIH